MKCVPAYIVGWVASYGYHYARSLANRWSFRHWRSLVSAIPSSVFGIGVLITSCRFNCRALLMWRFGFARWRIPAIAPRWISRFYHSCRSPRRSSSPATPCRHWSRWPVRNGLFMSDNYAATADCSVQRIIIPTPHALEISKAGKISSVDMPSDGLRFAREAASHCRNGVNTARGWNVNSPVTPTIIFPVRAFMLRIRTPAMCDKSTRIY